MTAAALQRQVLSRVVLTLLLAAALVPTMSRASSQARADAAPWGQGCAPATAAGGALSPTPADTEAWLHLLEHCPLCSLDRELSDGLPQGPVLMQPATLAGTSEATGWVPPERRPQPHWRTQPRAPPFVS